MFWIKPLWSHLVICWKFESPVQTNTRVVAISPVFFVSGLHSELHKMSMFGIATHLLGIFTVYKFDFVI